MESEITKVTQEIFSGGHSKAIDARRSILNGSTFERGRQSMLVGLLIIPPSITTPTTPHPHPHHHPQPPPLPSHHAVLMGAPHTQTQHHPPFNMPYPLPNPNNSISVSTATSNAAMMHQQRAQFPFNPAAPVQKPMDQQYSDGSPSGSGGGGLFSSEQAAARKKRGRPRKYSPDNSIGLGLSPAPVSQIPSAGGGGHVDSSGGTPSADTPAKRNRGRPPGSVKKQMDALGVPGVGFTPHVITVDPGEDIASKIVAFSQQGPRTVCILSANGAVCNVTLRQPVSGGTVTYEGRFEIISLSGSFLMSESNGSHSRTGSLSVSLAGPDGRVLGGGVAGVLKAASPVQVVVGSFIAEGKKPKTGLSSTPPPSSNMLTFGTPVTQPSPSSQGASSDSAEDNDGTSPLDPRGGPPGPYPNAGRPVQNMPMYANMGWANSMKIHPN
ncbi:putative DNA-binding protein escarola [Phtheirospermum japonicum]|uniref:AT-hook motif nuclear-localized protein n=1 Tax=Phtheirospermum japonicum TaxID=374723 RepID=A0A830CVU5_9LAMI|nr:putative DNA-binding protein escarola [Phtheirospermum japonicum]